MAILLKVLILLYYSQGLLTLAGLLVSNSVPPLLTPRSHLNMIQHVLNKFVVLYIKTNVSLHKCTITLYSVDRDGVTASQLNLIVLDCAVYELYKKKKFSRFHRCGHHC